VLESHGILEEKDLQNDKNLETPFKIKSHVYMQQRQFFGIIIIMKKIEIVKNFLILYY
jgi:hypothetical protein